MLYNDKFMASIYNACLVKTMSEDKPHSGIHVAGRSWPRRGHFLRGAGGLHFHRRGLRSGPEPVERDRRFHLELRILLLLR